MSQYLVAIHHPDDFDSSVETGAIPEDIHALNREMMAAGVRIFVGGLTPAREAKSLRAQPDGKVLTTDGPVSYTHLDVYKRQPNRRWSKIGQAQNWAPSW